MSAIKIVMLGALLSGCVALSPSAIPAPGCDAYLVEHIEADGQIYGDWHERCE